MSLPQATIIGVFSPTRSAENLVRHSGLICVDIDRKDNEHIENFDTLIEDVLSRIEEVAYASHSVSGRGYFVIIPLGYPQLHKAQFEQLVRVFADMGIYIDRACGDVCRLRCRVMTNCPTSISMQSHSAASIANRKNLVSCINVAMLKAMRKRRWHGFVERLRCGILTLQPTMKIG